MTFELYHTRHSTCSQKVRLTLAEKGCPERGQDWVDTGISSVEPQRGRADFSA